MKGYYSNNLFYCCSISYISVWLIKFLISNKSCFYGSWLPLVGDYDDVLIFLGKLNLEGLTGLIDPKFFNDSSLEFEDFWLS